MQPGKFEIRTATTEDVGLVLSFIRKLAVYERLLDQVEATEEKLLNTVFCEKPCAEVVIAYADDRPVGFALFFQTYSTFLAKPGIYLEDLFVDEDARGNGYGKALLVYLAQLAVQRNCGRLEWSVCWIGTNHRSIFMNRWEQSARKPGICIA